jgi:hypothetical protein
MCSISLAAPLIVALATCAFGQSDDMSVLSICQLLAEPTRYADKQVTVRAEVVEPRRVQLIDPADPKCGRIPWAYPTNRDVKPKPKFSLVEDAKFKELMDNVGLLLPPPPGSTRERSRIIALLEGRFDSVYRLKDGKPVRSVQGIGYLGGDEHVFVLHRVLKTEILPAAPAHEAQHAPDPAKPK